MATVQSSSFKNPAHMGAYGNVGGTIRMRHSTAAMTNGDIVQFGIIPAGTTVLDWIMLNSASSASATMSLGFSNYDGTATSPIDDDATLKVPAADWFLAATAISSAAVTRRGAPGTAANGKSFSLGPIKKDIIVYGTLGGANIATATLIELVFIYLVEGVK